MQKIQEILKDFEQISSAPHKELDKLVDSGKKVIGCFPYYVPEELVHAAGMVPFGIWGAEGTIKSAKEYFAAFYCTIAQMGLELALNGKLDKMSGIIMPSMCDTLRPLTQNFRIAITQLPFIFIAHPQNRKEEYGIKYTISQYKNVKEKLEEIAGTTITNDALQNSIDVFNKNRAARREFVKLAGEHPEAVAPIYRSAVLKSAYFMQKEDHTKILEELNSLLKELPKSEWNGKKVVTSGILADNKSFLKILENNNLAISADDVAQESRSFRKDAPKDADAMRSLALLFASQDDDTILYDPQIDKRPEHVVNLVKNSGANGVVILMMTFCDPEEMEYPSLKQALSKAGIPHVIIGYDQQMSDFAQAKTQLQSFADILNF